MDGNDATFIASSAVVANDLTRAQQPKNLAASKLIVISGRTSKKQVPFSAVIKSELQVGLTEKSNKGKTVVDYHGDIFFAESQSYTKSALFRKRAILATRRRQHFAVHLFDHLMTGTETRSAAFYFYSDFLGADVSASDRHRTREFFDKTSEFLQAQSISPAAKICAWRSIAC